MKALHFMIIDYIRARTQMTLIFVILTAVTFLMRFVTNGTELTIFLYGIFIVIVFSTVPFGNCTRADAGFLQLLPATTWQRVLGRFLYGLSLLAVGFVISVLCTAVYQLYSGVGIRMMELPFYMVVVAAGLLIITVQYALLYLIGENRGQNFLSLIRMIPGMSFFFGSIKLMGVIEKNPAKAAELLEFVGNRRNVIGWGSLIAALVVMAAGAILCTKVTEKRDF